MDINHQIIGYNSIFTFSECDYIIYQVTKSALKENSDYGHNSTLELDHHRPKNIVKNNTISLPRKEYHWVYDRISHILDECNLLFKFDINRIEDIHFLKYNVGDYYKKHHDLLMEMDGSRKLTISIQLSDSSEYKGGDLILHTGDIPCDTTVVKGNGTVFVATIVHEITKITSGQRYALVVHCSGPKWK
jgi:predicted 2-oxoglutarate/Fe(II)-dependent dioxygenase YbiX